MSNPSSPVELPARRTIFVGVIVPALFVWLNDRLFTQYSLSNNFWLSFQLLAACVVQVGIFGVLCGKLIEWPVLRWLIYGWCWLLIDIQFLSASWLSSGSYHDDSYLLVSGMFGAQIGLVTIWAILGTTRWAVRLPTAMLLITLLSLPMAIAAQRYYWHGPLNYLFVIQTVALAILCGVLRWNRYRLLLIENTSIPTPEQRASQFGMQDVLIWTTIMAVALAVARGFELFSPQMFTGYWYNAWNWGAALSHGWLLAMVLIVALWAALGQGPAWLRWSLLAVSSLLAGFMSAYMQYFADNRPTGRFILGQISWSIFWEWYRGWIAVFVLAASLLFATLLIVRVLGYRLQRAT